MGTSKKTCTEITLAGPRSYRSPNSLRLPSKACASSRSEAGVRIALESAREERTSHRGRTSPSSAPEQAKSRSRQVSFQGVRNGTAIKRSDKERVGSPEVDGDKPDALPCTHDHNRAAASIRGLQTALTRASEIRRAERGHERPRRRRFRRDAAKATAVIRSRSGSKFPRDQGQAGVLGRLGAGRLRKTRGVLEETRASGARSSRIS